MSKSSELGVLLKEGPYAGRTFQPDLVRGVITTEELYALAEEVGLPMRNARTVMTAAGLHETDALDRSLR